MIFQSGKYCDIVIHEYRGEDGIVVHDIYAIRIRDTGDTHLDIACKDLSHALELWTAIERSPEVKIVVNVSDYIVKDEFADCRHRPIKDCKPCEFDLERME